MAFDLLLIYILVFVFGLGIGSFLNSVAFRLETRESFLFKRSYCPHCRHQLAWYDLAPLLSFLALRGKCRYCSEKISWQYPVVEILTGTVFLLILAFQPVLDFLNLFYAWLIASFLIVILIYDFKHYIIPDKMVYPAIMAAVLYRLFEAFQSAEGAEVLLAPFLSAVLAAGFFFLIILASQGKWMGMGDVKLAFLMGLFLSFPGILLSLFLAFVFGAIIGVGLILARRKTLKSEVPFGPFLVIGTLIAWLWGEKIINWYLNLFL